MDTTFWNENTGEPRVWKLTSAVRRRAGGKGPAHRYLACCLSYYDLGEPLPDHSSLTRIRERYGVEIFRRFFDQIVEQCQQAGLVWGKELYFDGTKMEANASLDSLKPRFAVEAHLANLFERDAEEPAQEREQNPSQEAAPPEPGQPEETNLPTPLPVALSPEERAELSQHNAERHDWIEQLGAQDRQASSRGYQRMADLRVSTTDQDATLMLTKNGADMGYHTHYVVDGGKARIILHVLVTPSEVMDNQPMLDLLWRVRFRLKLWPRQVTGDRKYGTEENLVAIESQHIHAYIPSPDLDHRTELGYNKDSYKIGPFDSALKGTPAIQTTVRSTQVNRTQVKEKLKLLNGEEGWACTCVSARTMERCFSSRALPQAHRGTRQKEAVTLWSST